jgi:hypothetical protein
MIKRYTWLKEALEKIYSDPEECTAAARALAKKARKGSIAHFQEAANRLEGKVDSSDESAGNAVFNITISAARPLRHVPNEDFLKHYSVTFDFTKCASFSDRDSPP